MNSDPLQTSHSLFQQDSYPRQTWKLSQQNGEIKKYFPDHAAEKE